MLIHSSAAFWFRILFEVDAIMKNYIFLGIGYVKYFFMLRAAWLGWVVVSEIVELILFQLFSP